MVRIVSALDDLRHHKVDAIAIQVGYRSKKNFYRAFARLTGMTPGAFKKLPPTEMLQVRDDVLLRLTHGRVLQSQNGGGKEPHTCSS